jgi:hypothetical protein
MKTGFKMLVLAALAGTAMAAPRETTTYTNVISDGPLGAPENTVQTFAATGGYQVGKYVVSGTLTGLNVETFALEARVQVTPPGGRAPFIIQAFTEAEFSGSISFSAEIPAASPFDPAGNWSFRFFESFNDAGQDAQWDTWTFVFDDEVPPPPPPPPSTDLGTLVRGAPLLTQVSIGAAEIKWYRFNLPEAASVANQSWVDVWTTQNTALAPSNDTEIGIYNVQGNLRASDDDSGPGLLTQISFGQGGRNGLGDGLPRNGQAGALDAGVYYLAIGGFNMVFNATGFSVTSTSPNAGTAEMAIEYGRVCRADYNGNGSVDFFDYLDFVNDFEAGCE